MIPLGVLASARVVAAGGGGVAFRDDFNRADASTLGGDWKNRSAAFTINTNRAMGPTGGQICWALANTQASSDDYYVEAVIAAGSTAVARGVTARNDGVTSAHYLWSYSGSGFILYRTANGTSYTQLGSTYTAAPSQPITLRLEVEGTSIRGYVDGTLLASATDATYQTGRYAGMRKAGSGLLYVDSFEIGAL